MPFLEDLWKGTEEFFHALAEGWRNLIHRSGRALTRFVPTKKESEEPEIVEARWGLIAGELAETDDTVVARFEVPGLDREDIDITVVGNHLVVRGEKRFQKEEKNARYHLVESAYGAFERSLPIPAEVRPAEAEATYKKGVLTVRLPKVRPAQPIEIKIGK